MPVSRGVGHQKVPRLHNTGGESNTLYTVKRLARQCMRSTRPHAVPFELRCARAKCDCFPLCCGFVHAPLLPNTLMTGMTAAHMQGCDRSPLDGLSVLKSAVCV